LFFKRKPFDSYAEYYSAELSQKVKRGMRESCLKGNAAGIQPIFGYCIVDKKYQIVPQEAEIIRKIFDDYVNKDREEYVHRNMKTKQD